MNNTTSLTAGVFPAGYRISNRYTIKRALGTGGMGVVYLATDEALEGSLVAIKVLHRHLMQNETLCRRFLREVKLMRQVNHNNVVRTFDLGSDPEHTFFTMEFVKGSSLYREFSKRRLSIREVLSITMQVCKGLEAIHARGIIHRDLKPDNILLLDDGEAKITDFGIAKGEDSTLTQHDGILGTVAYIAPEILQKQPISYLVDYYSLGIILYQLLVGRPPFEADTPAAVVLMHVNETPTPPQELNPHIPAWLNRLIMSLLEKKPANRPQTLRPIIDLIETYLTRHSDELVDLDPALSENYYLAPPKNSPGAAPLSALAATMRTGARMTIMGLNTRSLTGELFPSWAKSAANRRIIRALAATLLIIVHFVLLHSSLGTSLEQGFSSTWFSIRGPIAPPEDVVVVAMDEQSYRNLKVPLTSSWPRQLHAELLEVLANYGAKRVVFDILFLDEGTDPEANSKLAEAMTKVPTVLGAAFSAQNRTTISGSFMIEEFLEPYKPFREAASKIALVTLPEEQGIIRQFNQQLPQNFPGTISLAEAAAGIEPDSDILPGKRDYINFYGPARTIPMYSYDTVLEKERPLPANVFLDKIVIVGLVLRSESGPAQKESFLTPFGNERMFGTEIHATATANLLQQNWLRRPASWIETMWLWGAGWILLFIIFSLKPLQGLAFCAGPLMIWLVASYKMFTLGTVIVGSTLFVVILPLAYMLTVLYHQILRDLYFKRMMDETI